MHGLGQTSMQACQEGAASPNLECFWLQLFNGSGNLFGKRPYCTLEFQQPEPPLKQQELLRRQQWRQMAPVCFACERQLRDTPAMAPPSRSCLKKLSSYGPTIQEQLPLVLCITKPPAMATPSRSSFKKLSSYGCAIQEQFPSEVWA